jgi:hypothetical protein
VPVGALARIDDRHIHLTSGVFSLAAHPPVRATQVGTDPIDVGQRAADELVALGAAKILAEFDREVRGSGPFILDAPASAMPDLPGGH